MTHRLLFSSWSNKLAELVSGSGSWSGVKPACPVFLACVSASFSLFYLVSLQDQIPVLGYLQVAFTTMEVGCTAQKKESSKKKN